MTFKNFGVALGTRHSSQHHVRTAKLAEKLGLDSHWLTESYHLRSAIPIAAAIADETSKITIGIGVVPTHTRHPGLLAMDTNTLDEISGGRLIMGIGAAKPVAEKHGFTGSYVRQMRDTITIMRGLLDGEKVTYVGKEYSINGTGIDVPARKGAPIYVGTYSFSPKMLEVAGELADGVIYAWASPKTVRSGFEHIAAGAAKAGRDPSKIDVVSFHFLSVNENAQKARDACRRIVATYTAFDCPTWRRAGLVADEDVEPVLQALQAGGVDAATPMVTDALIDKVAIAGDARYVRDRLKEFDGTGVRLPVALEIHGDDPEEALLAIKSAFVE